MADEITIISNEIEVHACENGRYAVVRSGRVYAELDTQAEAIELAEELAEGEDE